MRPAFRAKSGSRGKIQLRCCQGRRASALNQRQSVVPLTWATMPWAVTSLSLDIGQRQSGERQSEAMRKLTGQGFYLHDDAGGKRARDARPEVVRRGRADGLMRIVCATC